MISPEELPLPLGGKMSTQVDNENDEMRRNYRITLKKEEFIRGHFSRKKEILIWSSEYKDKRKKYKEKKEELGLNFKETCTITAKLMSKIPERKPRNELCENANEPLTGSWIGENDVSATLLPDLETTEAESDENDLPETLIKSRLGENENLQDASIVSGNEMKMKKIDGVGPKIRNSNIDESCSDEPNKEILEISNIFPSTNIIPSKRISEEVNLVPNCKNILDSESLLSTSIHKVILTNLTNNKQSRFKRHSFDICSIENTGLFKGTHSSKSNLEKTDLSMIELKTPKNLPKLPSSEKEENKNTKVKKEEILRWKKENPMMKDRKVPNTKKETAVEKEHTDNPKRRKLKKKM